jgi:hypothetical protein
MSLGDVSSFVPEVTFRSKIIKRWRSGAAAYTARPTKSDKASAAPMMGCSHDIRDPREAQSAAALYVVNMESPVTE